MKTKTFGPGLEKGMEVYVGIDQSYSGFGLTLYHDDQHWISTVTKFDTKGVDRLMEVWNHVYKSLHGYYIVDVAMEGYAYGSQMANMAGELGGIVKLCLLSEFQRYPLIVPPTSLKKYVTGSGNASGKSQIMLHVYKTWKVELLDDNAADSYGLARLASKYASNNKHRDVLATLSDPKYREGSHREEA